MRIKILHIYRSFKAILEDTVESVGNPESHNLTLELKENLALPMGLKILVVQFLVYLYSNAELHTWTFT